MISRNDVDDGDVFIEEIKEKIGYHAVESCENCTYYDSPRGGGPLQCWRFMKTLGIRFSTSGQFHCKLWEIRPTESQTEESENK